MSAKQQPSPQELSKEYALKFKRAFEKKTLGAAHAAQMPENINGICFFTADLSQNRRYYRGHRLQQVRVLTPQELDAVCKLLNVDLSKQEPEQEQQEPQQ